MAAVRMLGDAASILNGATPAANGRSRGPESPVREFVAYVPLLSGIVRGWQAQSADSTA